MGAHHDRSRYLSYDHPDLASRLASIQSLQRTPLRPLLAPRSHSRSMHSARLHHRRKHHRQHLHLVPSQAPNLKASVRQRRVMTDLIYVNVIAVCLDVLTVVLVYLNQTGISHPIQAFSYILKLKLEFLVLNQLMAVAARGVQKESFAERRYHRPSTTSGEKASSAAASSKTSRWGLDSLNEPSRHGSARAREVVVPSPTLSRARGTSHDSGPENTHGYAHGGKWPVKGSVKKRGAGDHGAEEDEDEDIGVHMWEKGGKLVMEVPWFKMECQA